MRVNKRLELTKDSETNHQSLEFGVFIHTFFILKVIKIY